jgi:exodeoxyribonuclease VII large subunit
MSTGFFDFHARVARGRRGQPEQSTLGPPAEAAATGPGSGTARGPGAAPPSLTVSELSQQIAGAIRTGFPSPVWVKGEVTGYRGPQPSGHHYFSLKDATATINCVVWAGEARNIRFKWTDGMEVLALGSVATYAARSNYQLKISQLLPVGQGALELAFRQMKERLGAEGLFDQGRKKPIPPFPMRVALVTSRGAAGFADMLKVLRRFPWLKLMLFHVPVQGAAAAPAIAAALAALNRHAEAVGGIDAILLGRGGGSMEDLWAFNEEVVARAVADSDIPVVTGIGHEVDTSIADLAADYHAHTPTEAAQVLTQNWRLAKPMVAGAADRLNQRIRDTVNLARERVSAVRRHEAFRRPLDVLVRSRQQLVDDLDKSLKLSMHLRFGEVRDRLAEVDYRLQMHRPTAQLSALRDKLDNLTARMAERHPRHTVRRLTDRVATLEGCLRAAARQTVARHVARVDALARELDAVGPAQVMRRGYSITMRKRDRHVIRAAADIRKGDVMVTRFADGEYEWTAGDGQLGLFP